MKWAADPMVPFRRAEHWPPDLYLIDQPVQEGKKDPLLQRGLFPLHCSISDRRSLWKMKNSFENPFLKPSWAKYCIKLRCTGKCGKCRLFFYTCIHQAWENQCSYCIKYFNGSFDYKNALFFSHLIMNLIYFWESSQMFDLQHPNSTFSHI